jgi:CCR4-NOT transcription complex subunit 6
MGVNGRHHQKQLEHLQLSRQSASPHHHARVAAAAARTGMGTDSAAGSTNSLVNPNEKPSQWTIIDLGGMQIKNLSSALFQYTFLTTLYLNHNNLTYLSHDICKLKNLVSLDLSGNKLTSVPSELGLVVSLKELMLFDNQLSYLPPELGSLYQVGNELWFLTVAKHGGAWTTTSILVKIPFA